MDFNTEVAKMFTDKHFEDIERIKKAADKDVNEFVQNAGIRALQAVFEIAFKIGFEEGIKHANNTKKKG